MTFSAEYEVQIFTGNQMNAGTDANVYVTLYGAKGTSARVQLRKSTRNNFEKGGKDSFRVTAADVGSIAKLKSVAFNQLCLFTTWSCLK